MLPRDAVLEADLGDGVALYDVSALLPYRRQLHRPAAKIERVYHHHTGALGREGFKGLEGSARYVVMKRGFPGTAYTFWLSYEPDFDADGRLVVYRAQPDDVVSWHTGGLNRTGVAVGWQGNLSEMPPSFAQLRAAIQLCTYLDGRYSLDHDVPHSYHSEAARFGGRPKRSCPGSHVERWVRAWRRKSAPVLQA